MRPTCIPQSNKRDAEQQMLAACIVNSSQLDQVKETLRMALLMSLTGTPKSIRPGHSLIPAGLERPIAEKLLSSDFMLRSVAGEEDGPLCATIVCDGQEYDLEYIVLFNQGPQNLFSELNIVDKSTGQVEQTVHRDYGLEANDNLEIGYGLLSHQQVAASGKTVFLKQGPIALQTRIANKSLGHGNVIFNSDGPRISDVSDLWGLPRPEQDYLTVLSSILSSSDVHLWDNWGELVDDICSQAFELPVNWQSRLVEDTRRWRVASIAFDPVMRRKSDKNVTQWDAVSDILESMGFDANLQLQWMSNMAARAPQDGTVASSPFLKCFLQACRRFGTDGAGITREVPEAVFREATEIGFGANQGNGRLDDEDMKEITPILRAELLQERMNAKGPAAAAHLSVPSNSL